MARKHTYSVFREKMIFEKDGYHLFHGIPMKQEYDQWNGCFWYTFRNKTDYLRLNGKLHTWF